MKLQNTLFIATAICFYILLGSRPADSCKDMLHHPRPIFGCDNFQPCKSDGSCQDEYHKCLYRQHSDISNGLCVPKCRLHGTCLDPNFKCINPMNTFPWQSYCIPLTTEYARTLPECDDKFECEGSRVCFGIHLDKSTAIFRCMFSPYV